ncbi:MAG: DUF1573 domain-containing protein [Candidatus Hydrogenedentes bacterium]|nr:DUF1573 domain-containing protein [Candidatus Hydrogenedentota bacterium]
MRSLSIRRQHSLLVLLFAAAVLTDFCHAAPKAVFDKVKLDYGTLRQGKIGEAVVKINNTGDQPLEIQNVQSSCPCATTDFSPKDAKPTVAPGAQHELTLKYDSKDVVGDRVATIVVTTNDPQEPMTAIDIAVKVEALVLTMPDKALSWGMAPRGDDIGKDLTFVSGTSIKDIELLDIHMAAPTLSVTATREETKDGSRIKARFRISPDVPLGSISNSVTARLRVGNEEATLKIPVQGEAVGDVLVMPQSILCAPKLAYIQNQPLSKEGIIVRASRPNQPLPDVLGVVAVGPISCIIHKNVKPEWGQQIDRHIIEVRTAQNAPPGAQSGTVHVMTTSKDQPIVSIPVFFRMASRVAAEPAQVLLEPSANAPATQRVVMRDATGAALTIREVKFEEDLLAVKVESEKSVDADHPAAIVLTASQVPPAERKATIVSVATDQPGAERILIPVLIRDPQTQ